MEFPWFSRRSSNITYRFKLNQSCGMEAANGSSSISLLLNLAASSFGASWGSSVSPITCISTAIHLPLLTFLSTVSFSTNSWCFCSASFPPVTLTALSIKFPESRLPWKPFPVPWCVYVWCGLVFYFMRDRNSACFFSFTTIIFIIIALYSDETLQTVISFSLVTKLLPATSHSQQASSLVPL